MLHVESVSFWRGPKGLKREFPSVRAEFTSPSVHMREESPSLLRCLLLFEVEIV